MTHRITLIAIVLLVFAAPAWAKGVDGVILTAGDQEIVVEWQHVYGEVGDLASLVEATGVYDVDWRDGDRQVRPPGDLGPVVVARWNFPDPVGSVIVQHLYPFAAGGPVAHVPPGQEYLDSVIEGTWHPLRSDVAEVLEAAGLDLGRLEGESDSGLALGGIVLGLSAIIAGWLRQVA